MGTMRAMRVGMIVAATLPLAAVAQTPRVTQLNRTVIVTPGATAVVTPECEQGLASQPQPRVTREERTAVALVPVPAPPPSADLRGTLQAAVDAAQHRDRNTFNERLAHAKEILASYPPGAERNAASEVVAVLDDVKRLWDYEFASPTGAFFDASSDAYRIMSRYPGYDAAVRRQVITDQNGTKFYPTAESRDLLASDAATRLAHLTGHAATTTTTAKPVENAPPPQVTHKRPTLKQHHVTKPAPTTTTTTHARKAKKTPVKRTHRRRVEKAAVTPAPHHAKQATTTTAAVKTTAAPAPKPVAAKKAPAPAPPPARSVAAKEAPAPAPVTTSSAPAETTASTTVAPPPPPAPAATTTAATETIARAAQPQTETQPQPAKRTSRTNLILPIILIIAGVGLLVFFSRSSA